VSFEEENLNSRTALGEPSLLIIINISKSGSPEIFKDDFYQKKTVEGRGQAITVCQV
jgi:hypothetical protein